MPQPAYDPISDGDIVTIARRFDPIAAELLRGRLAADGIPATLGDAHLVQADALWATALGGVRVMVPAAYAPRALRAIAAIEHGELQLEDEDDEDMDEPAPVEPRDAPLGSRDARLPRLALGGTALLVLIAVLELLSRTSSPMLR